MITPKNALRFTLLFLCGCFAAEKASASTVPYSGTFADDTSSFHVSFTSTSLQNYLFTTTSFAAGGFVPVLTLYNTTTGATLGSDGGDGPCVTAATCKDDASLSQTLGAGSYSLYLTEFPNTPSPTGTFAGGFLFGLDPAGEPTLTGDLCGVSGGMFLQTDTAVCTQRSNQYAFTITNNAVSTTPEPATLFLVVPPVLLLLGFSRRMTA